MGLMRLGRREFIYLSFCAVFSKWKSFGAELDRYKALTASLPAHPAERPLAWRQRGDAFDKYVMDPANKILQTRADGSRYFASALEGTGDGGMTTFGPLVLGKILRGDTVDSLVPSMAAYFSDEAGIFLDGTHADLCEYWYLMNVNALADGIVRLHLSHDRVWTGRVRKSADRLVELAHQINYNFNDQGYRFNTRVPFTNQDIYRQPDAIGGYAYLMLFAYEMFDDAKYLAEAKKGLNLYQSFAKNPWYEIPSGAMACLGAARLSVHDPQIDMHKIVSFALETDGHPDADRQLGWPGGEWPDGRLQHRACGRSIQHGIAGDPTVSSACAAIPAGVRQRHRKVSAEYGREYAAVLFRLHSAREPESTGADFGDSL